MAVVHTSLFPSQLALYFAGSVAWQSDLKVPGPHILVGEIRAERPNHSDQLYFHDDKSAVHAQA